MDKTLASSSGILYIKSKFFLIRVLTYFSFLFLPIWIPKTDNVPSGVQAIMIALYILFIFSQWFFLGKEIDHRLKIYFRVNSSMDRVVYRLFLGMFFFILYFNVLNLFPSKWIYNLFWVTWVCLGIFYSWPTRGKIIRESVTTNFSEFRYLDAFEKTLVFLIITLFFVSIPDLPQLRDPDTLKLFFDPKELINPVMWNFITVNYYPFYRYPELLKITWSVHFYLVNLSLFLLVFYAFLRFFVSRRLSLLGVFAVVSSWSWTKVLVADYGSALFGTYSLLWVWTLLWVARSSTYRTGLFLGLVSFYGTLISKTWIFLIIPQIVLMNYFLPKKTMWYKRQILRYALFGIVLSVICFFIGKNSQGMRSELFNFDFAAMWEETDRLFSRKAFFALAPFGLLLITLSLSDRFKRSVGDLKIDKAYLFQITWAVGILLAYSLVGGLGIFGSFSFMWVYALFSLLPLELIFQTMSRVRSSRNMVYLIYILICLLDSHFEGRIKIILRTFNL